MQAVNLGGDPRERWKRNGDGRQGLERRQPTKGLLSSSWLLLWAIAAEPTRDSGRQFEHGSQLSPPMSEYLSLMPLCHWWRAAPAGVSSKQPVQDRGECEGNSRPAALFWKTALRM